MRWGLKKLSPTTAWKCSQAAEWEMLGGRCYMHGVTFRVACVSVYFKGWTKACERSTDGCKCRILYIIMYTFNQGLYFFPGLTTFNPVVGEMYRHISIYCRFYVPLSHRFLVVGPHFTDECARVHKSKHMYALTLMQSESSHPNLLVQTCT